MGHDPDRQLPFFFQKNPSNLDPTGIFPYPPQTSIVHYEVELAVMLKRGGTDITVESANKHIFGYAIALDMTRRDLQDTAKKLGRPWGVSKAFERSAPIGPVYPAEDRYLESGKIALKVNGQLKQQGNLDQMIWSIPETISHLSKFYDLKPGDVILTGTPSGVGDVSRGDLMEASIENLNTLRVNVI